MFAAAFFVVATLSGVLAAPEPRAVSAEEAVSLAVPAANAALDQAYAAFAKRPSVVAPRRTRPWVTAAGASKTAMGGGYLVKWQHVAPAGYEFEVEVSVDVAKHVVVKKASASFSPD